MASFVAETWNFLKGRPDHPVYQRERRGWSYIRAWRSIKRGCLPLIAVVIFGIIGCCGLAFMPLISEEPNSWPFGLLVVIYGLFIGGEMVKWVTGVAATGLTATTVSAEVEADTYGLLRLTLIPAREVVLAKFASAVHELRLPVTAVIVIRLITLIAGTGALILAIAVGISQSSPSQTGIPSSGSYPLELIPADVLLPILASGAAAIIASITAFVLWLAYFFIQPVLDVILFAAVGIFASTLSRTRSGGLFVAGGVRVGLWTLSYVGSQVLSVGISLLAVPLTTIPVVGLWLTNLQNASPGTIIIAIAAATMISLVIVVGVQIVVTLFLLRTASQRAERLPYGA